MVYPYTQRPICSIFLSWIAVLNNVGPRLWWPGEYSIVFRGTTDKIWSLLPIHHSNLNRDFKLRPPNIRKFWSTATATAICKSWWWLRLPEPIHGKFGRGCRWKSRLRLKIAVVDGALKRQSEWYMTRLLKLKISRWRGELYTSPVTLVTRGRGINICSAIYRYANPVTCSKSINYNLKTHTVKNCTICT